jgi:cell division FtsZ-interacting protein ZapD
MAAQMMDAIAIISDSLVKGVDQEALESLSMELTKDPTRLMATKKTKFDMYTPHEV